MANSYEALVPAAGRDFFQAAFIRYMDGRGFSHARAGGRVGGTVSHEFKRDDETVTLSVARKGQRHFRMVVHTEATPVEALALDVLTEGVADFLEPFCETLSEKASAEILESLVGELRDSFASLLERHR